ncbi:hypothetical protein GCM10010399_50230 [Dactylosporangium fulvum]|uniref:High-affinity nickel-transporter n=1 Tax=Dactylosporangium fulvum TaxID=53359 RepID=A0ABY5W856_9ACTN|nr:hypothetical protein [Dactylosporangium fulvum]UWP86057.1 hypothetical protein Dfulv_18165 [Dactylosporangium fulvum]
MRRLLVLLCTVVVTVVPAGVLLAPGPAHAHPLGNFSVNQLGALTFHPSRVDVLALVDLAELPTLQEQSTVDSMGAPAWAARECSALTGAFSVRVGGAPLAWTVGTSSYTYTEGSAGLRTSRLECTLSAPAPLAAPSTVDVENRYRTDRVGWRELTATASGVHLVSPPLPAKSRSDGLRSYPDDLLSSPPDVRSARLTVEPGGSTAASPGDTAVAAPVLPGRLGRAEATLRGWVGTRELTPWVGALAVLLALVLGGAHATLPGHGKTVMAAYLAGRRGRPRDALTVGATVTLTHTGGVLVLGLLLTTAAGLAGETVLGWLGVTSGALVAAVGLGMLLSRRKQAAHSHAHDHPHPHSHSHSHSHDHGGRPSRLAIVGMGVAGGLVPSPSALVVLLGAVGLGRTWFGVLLVLAYGLGMAAVLTAAGLLLIKVRDRWAGRLRLSGRLGGRLGGRLAWFTRLAPTGTAALVLVVGSALAVRSLVTL